MPTNDVSTDFEPISISSAGDGWRALYVDDNGIVQAVLPLAGWAVWRIQTIDDETGDVLDTITKLAGTVLDGGGFPACALGLEDLQLWRYLPPGDPDPVVGELVPEREQGATTEPGRRRDGGRATRDG
jgi:hypothetical protein